MSQIPTWPSVTEYCHTSRPHFRRTFAEPLGDVRVLRLQKARLTTGPAPGVCRSHRPQARRVLEGPLASVIPGAFGEMTSGPPIRKDHSLTHSTPFPS